MKRCSWAEKDSLYMKYHDKEWGTPLRNDRKLFEFLVLEGAQAGLSWSTILKRRENYRKAFHRFDPAKVSKYAEKDVKRLVNNAGIIRNRLKIVSAINNAKRFLEVKKEFGSFSNYIWQFVNNKPIINRFKKLSQIPAITKKSEIMSKDLKKRGFTFVGPTICYAYMQSIGMVNDHLVDCFRHKQLK